MKLIELGGLGTIWNNYNKFLSIYIFLCYVGQLDIFFQENAAGGTVHDHLPKNAK